MIECWFIILFCFMNIYYLDTLIKWNVFYLLGVSFFLCFFVTGTGLPRQLESEHKFDKLVFLLGEVQNQSNILQQCLQHFVLVITRGIILSWHRRTTKMYIHKHHCFCCCCMYRCWENCVLQHLFYCGPTKKL